MLWNLKGMIEVTNLYEKYTVDTCDNRASAHRDRLQQNNN